MNLTEFQNRVEDLEGIVADRSVSINARAAAMDELQQLEDKYVVRKNLMSGKDYLEERGTPISCSPASETYWSM